MLLSHLVQYYSIVLLNVTLEFGIVLQVLYLVQVRSTPEIPISSLNTCHTSCRSYRSYRFHTLESRAVFHEQLLVLASVLLTLVCDSSYVADESKSVGDHLTDATRPNFPTDFSRRFAWELAFLAPTTRTTRTETIRPVKCVKRSTRTP